MDKQSRVRAAADVRRRPRESAALRRSEAPAIYLSRRGPGIPGAPQTSPPDQPITPRRCRTLPHAPGLQRWASQSRRAVAPLARPVLTPRQPSGTVR